MKLLVSVFCLLLSASVWANKLEELTYITESYPPFNYEEGGQLKGIAIDVLEAATEAVGDPVGRKDVKLQAWARGYASALSGPNVVLFSTTKTKEREPKFKWVGPIIDTKVVVFSAKDVVIKDASELNNYRIGVVRDDIGEQLLQQQGVKSSSLKVSPEPTFWLSKLMLDVLICWPMKKPLPPI
ncbi:ABC transporter substrate-binding protein [Vibrio ostreicida]|uniref:ABC transporter substrate-binding protein n=1 Tax=Vibrio ostreicida TaxID=526588 RepID=A0ABT8BYK2_9VIBR|nr:ABC transporter substrate-binding protein [Vibrio ostreicida]MDN3611167.1 ABC transporter substrate-binding protein [Vibrio ostreicida]